MESATQRVQLLLNELEASDGVALLFHDGACEWALQYDDESIVHLTWREGHPRLELACMVAPLPDEPNGSLLKALLMFNYLSEDSGGARLAVSAHDNQVRLLRDLAPSLLELPILKQALQGMRACALDVRMFLDDLTSSASATAQSAQPHQLFA